MLFLYVFVLSQVFYQVTTDRNEGFVPPLITMDQLEKISKVLLKPPGNEAIYDENVLSDQFNEERYFLRKKKRRMSKGCRNSLRELHPIVCGIRTNGCGGEVKNTKNIPFGATVWNACTKHDVCYECGASRGWTQKQCDDSFYNDMLRLCNCQHNSFTAALCRLTARIYRKVVVLFGHHYFVKSNKKVCSSRCVKDKGSPRRTL